MARLSVTITLQRKGSLPSNSSDSGQDCQTALDCSTSWHGFAIFFFTSEDGYWSSGCPLLLVPTCVLLLVGASAVILSAIS